MSATTLLQRVIAGADLSRLEGDSDIAALLDEVAAALRNSATEAVAWRYVPSQAWGAHVFTDDPKQAAIAREMGCKVDALGVIPPDSAQPASPPSTPATLSADDARQVQSLLAALRDQAASNQTHIDQLAVDLRHLQAIATAAAALCDAAEEVECENGLGLWAQHGQWEPLHDALDAMTSTPAPNP